MRKKELLASLMVLGAILLATGIAAFGTPSGGEDAELGNISLLDTTTAAGETNFIVQQFSIKDNGTTGYPTEVEQICVTEAGSTLPDRYVRQIKLYDATVNVILGGINGALNTVIAGDDTGVPAILPGANGLIDSVPAGDDIVSFVGPAPRGILPGPNGVIDTVAAGDDVNTTPANGAILPGVNGILDSLPLAGDDEVGTFGDPASHRLLGVIRRPNLTDGECFGRTGRLLAHIPNGVTLFFQIKADFAFDAPDGLSLRLVTHAIADDGLIGGADTSNDFIAGKDSALGDMVHIDNTTSTDTGAQLVVEPNDIEVEPGTPYVLLGQFDVEDLGGDGDDRGDGDDLYLQHITAILTGTRGGSNDIDVLRGIRWVGLYVERGSTPPGFQPEDRLLARINNPFLVGERITVDDEEKLLLVFGRRMRSLMWIPDGGDERLYVERLYVVAGFGTEFQEGDEVKLEIIAGAKDPHGDTSSAFVHDPSQPVPAYNPVLIRIAPPTLVIGSATVSSAGKLVVSMKNIPAPGLGSLTATFIYDPAVADVALDTLGNPKVRALARNYDVIADFDAEGNLVVMATLKPGRKALTGDFDLLEIEFEAVGAAGDQTEITVDPWSLIANDADGNPLTLDISPGKIEVRLLKGDVDFDGLVTRRDAREVARFIVGKSTLSWTKQRQLAADVAAPFCDPDFLADPATVAPACIDASDVRAIMLAAYGLISLSSAQAQAVEPLQVKAITLSQGKDAFTLAVNGQGVASVGLQLYNLAGGLVLNKEAQGNTLQFQLNGPGGAWANGVYLYVVTVRGHDGTVIRSEVRKLVVLR